MACAVRSRIDKWDLIKLKSFYKAKDIFDKTSRQPTDCQKIFTNLTSGRGLISKIYKKLKSITKKPNNPIIYMVRFKGFEPLAHALEGRCSIQLS